MKVKELVEILKTQDQEIEVVMAKDPDGNGYHDIQQPCISNGVFEYPFDADKDQFDAVVLWPSAPLEEVWDDEAY